MYVFATIAQKEWYQQMLQIEFVFYGLSNKLAASSTHKAIQALCIAIPYTCIHVHRYILTKFINVIELRCYVPW